MSHEDTVRAIDSRYSALLEEVEHFSTENGLSTPKILVVSKKRPIEDILAAIDVGISEFGESFARELKEKAEELDSSSIKWHFIGHLQSRNVKFMAEHTHLLHSLDKNKLVRRLTKRGFSGETLIQVKISHEKTKFGVEMDEVEDLIEYANKKSIKVNGLMAMADPHWDKSQMLYEFAKVSYLSKQLDLPVVSMGMSDDWQEAILSGATILRIGTKIFGPRI
jgi:hypothetical protein